MIRFLAALALLAGATVPLRAKVLTIATPGPVSSLAQDGDGIRVELRGETLRLVTCPATIFCLEPLSVQSEPSRPQGIVPDGKVAVARKLAVILHRMWIDGTSFRWQPASPTEV